MGVSRVLFDLVTSLPVAQDFVRSWQVMLSVSVVACVSFVIACWQPLWQLIMTPALQLLKSDDTVSSRQRLLSYVILLIGSWSILAILTQTVWFAAMVVVIASVVMKIGYWLMMK